MSDRDVRDIFGVYRRILVEATEEQPVRSKQKGVTPEQKDRLSMLKIKMEDRIPLFSKLIRLAPIIFTYDLPTMAVDNRDNLYINPEFFDRLSDDGVIAVLAHEMYHIFHEHPKDIQIRNLNQKLWNYATDYVINRDLLDYGIDIKNITKSRADQINCLIPKKIGDKYILRIGDTNKDVSYISIFELYKLIVDEATRQRKSLEETLKELEGQTGENWDEEPIDIGEPEDEKSKPATQPFKVGETVYDLSSGVKGIVVKASAPDENGDQILDVDWDVSVVERYINEEVETGVHSKRVRREEEQQQQQKQQKQQKQDQKQDQDQGDQQKQSKSQQDKGEQGKESKPQQGGGETKSQQQQDKSQGAGKGGEEKEKGKETKIPKPAEGQDQAPRSQPLDKFEKDEIRKEGEYYQKEYERILKSGEKMDIKGKGSVNWMRELERVLKIASEERSTFLPDIRSTGAGVFIRGTERKKENMSLTVMVDTSGSVSESMFKLFMREIITIIKRLPNQPVINVILWHSQVYSGTELFNISAKNASKLLSVKVQTGGTNFSSALKFYSAHQKELKNDKAIIVFTDGDFFGADQDPNLLNTYIKRDVPVIFSLFQPSTTKTISKYNKPNKRIIETNIDQYS